MNARTLKVVVFVCLLVASYLYTCNCDLTLDVPARPHTGTTLRLPLR